MSVDAEYYIEYRDSYGQWNEIGQRLNTRKKIIEKKSFLGLFSYNSEEVGEHDDPGTRKKIEQQAKIIRKEKKSDVRILCDYWDSAGYGEGSTSIVWKNGYWLD